jgi:hypothetical protein
VKLNAIALAVLLVFISWLESTRRGKPNTAIALFMAIYVIFIIYINIRIIYQARQDISISLRDGAINAAASAVEFRDAARARVNERVEERRRSSNGRNDNANPEIEEQFSEAIRREDLVTVKRFLFNDLVSARGCNRNGRGWLQYATVVGSVKAAEAILQAGASPQEKDDIGRSAIEEAEIRDNSALIALLNKSL